MATIKDIARLSGFSVGTVSRVINDHPDVSEETRKKIQKIIKKENFQPNANAKMLKQTRTSSVSVIVKGTGNLFLNSLLEKIQMFLRENEEEAFVTFLKESENEVLFAGQLCVERNPKGLIFLGGDLACFQKDFAQISTPSVLATADASGLPFENLSSFSTDDYKASREAAGLLIRKGHRNIGIIGGFNTFEEEQVSCRRVMGAVDMMKENHIDFDRGNYMECSFSMQDGYEKTKYLLERNPEMTAVFAIGDLIAIGALRAIRDAGLKVPQDISLIGFDGIENTDYTVPRITTVRQDIDAIAKKSVDDLLFRISYPRPAVHEFIPFELIEKDSVGSV